MGFNWTQVSLLEAFGSKAGNRVRAVRDQSWSPRGCSSHTAQFAEELGTTVDRGSTEGEQDHSRWARQKDSGTAMAGAHVESRRRRNAGLQHHHAGCSLSLFGAGEMLLQNGVDL